MHKSAYKNMKKMDEFLGVFKALSDRTRLRKRLSLGDGYRVVLNIKKGAER
jgi:hypothetical protein